MRAAAVEPPTVIDLRTSVNEAEILTAARSLGSAGQFNGGVWRELADPDVNLHRLRNAVLEDPTLAARVLKVANSAFYRCGGKISTLEHAVVLLGLDAVRGIAAAAGLDRIAAGGNRARVYVAHSVATASVARDVAALAGHSCGAEAFLAGLLHDLGLLVAWRLAARHGAGARVVGVDAIHVRCSMVAMEAWSFPPALIKAVGGHHDLPQAGAASDVLGACVRLAHRLCENAGFVLEDDNAGTVEVADGAVVDPLQLAADAIDIDLEVLGLSPGEWHDGVPILIERATAMGNSLVP